MNHNFLRKLCTVERLEAIGTSHRAEGKSVVLCHGCFDIVHPGHLRYLQFACEQGDVLVVSLTSDDAIEKSDGKRPYLPQELRAEALAALEFVHHVVVAETPGAEPVIRRLRPDLYVKGKDYEHSFHPGFRAEKALVEELGGKVMFSSGDVTFSSTALLDEFGGTLEAEGYGPGSPARLSACCERWGLDLACLDEMIRNRFTGRKVVVVGDLICDRYVFCDAGALAAEAPVLSVRPLKEEHYVGGAGVVAAHFRGLGAQVELLSRTGVDAPSEVMVERLQEQGVESHFWPLRAALPLKERYLVETQKVLKVDRGGVQPLDSEVEAKVLGALIERGRGADAVVFCDFGYGMISPRLLSQALPKLRRSAGTIAGDVSRPRSTLGAMRRMDLLAPTERELRSVLGDFDASLPGVAFRLMKRLRVPNLAVTMGSKGCILFRPRESEPSHWFRSRLRSEYIPSLASHAIDTVGAGDAFLAAATLALSSGASLNQSGYLGSAAAALEVGRIGNQPVNAAALLGWLRARPELRPSRFRARYG